MEIPRLMQNARLAFAGFMALLLLFFFTLSVTFRSSELALLESGSRFLAAAGYRMEFAGVANLAAALGAGGASSAEDAPRGTAEAVPVLVYHGIVKDADRFSMTAATFKEQMFALARDGWRTVTLEEFEAYMRGERELPDKSFLLTFDDGRRDSFEGADPVLSAVGFHAVMFVASGQSLGDPAEHNRYYLDERGLRRMLATGRWELGSHAVQDDGGFVPVDPEGLEGNFLSSKRWLPEEERVETDTEYAARLKDELTESKEALEETFGAEIAAFSYPFGDYGQQSSNHPAAERAIADALIGVYDMAFQQVWPLHDEFSENYPGEERLHRLRRIEVGTRWSGSELLSYLEAGRAKPLPYEAAFAADEGWKHNWGSVDLRDEVMGVAASATSTGALTFLDGTGAWTDHRTEMSAIRTEGSYVSLIARYRNVSNLAVCTWSDGEVEIEERVDGRMYDLASKRSERFAGKGEMALAMETEGLEVRCLSDGEAVLSARLSPALRSGGVGIRVWNEEPGTAALSVGAFSAAPLP